MGVILALAMPLLLIGGVAVAWERVPRSWPWRRRLQWGVIAVSVMSMGALIASRTNVWWGAAAGSGLAASATARMRWARWRR